MAEQGEKFPTRKLRVASYEIIGKTKKGADIYKVHAVNPDGSPVEEELRAFQEVPVGEIVEYGIKKYVHESYGTSYTLYPPKEKLGTRVAALEERVAGLESRLDALTAGETGATNDDDPLPI